MYKTIYIIGFMYAGKSTLSKKLSKLLSMVSYDTDIEFEKEHKTTISDYIRDFGEDDFRDKETKLLHYLSNKTEDKIIATGGGLPCFNSNIDYMRKKGCVLYLEADAEFLAERISKGGVAGILARPILLSSGILPMTTNYHNLKYEDVNIAAIEKLLSMRTTYYKQANIIVGANKQVLHPIVQAITYYYTIEDK